MFTGRVTRWKCTETPLKSRKMPIDLKLNSSKCPLLGALTKVARWNQWNGQNVSKNANVPNNMAQNVHFWSPWSPLLRWCNTTLELHRSRSRCQIMIGLHGDFLVGIIFIKQRLSMVLALIILKKCVLAAIKAQKGIGKQLSLPARNRGRCTAWCKRQNKSELKKIYIKVRLSFFKRLACYEYVLDL